MKNIVIVGCGKGIGLAAAKILAEQHRIIGISKTENAEINQLNIEFYALIWMILISLKPSTA